MNHHIPDFSTNVHYSVTPALNWDKKISKIKSLLTTWKSRDLTFFGKITVIKTLALPQLIFSAIHTTTPDNIYKKINAILYEFL